MGRVYLLQSPEFLNTNVFKIGHSNSDDLKRCFSYGSKTILYYTRICQNSSFVEKKLIEGFNKRFKVYKGREYFIGNINEMINEFQVIYDDLFFDRDNSRNICHTLYENVDDNMINTNKCIYTENNVESYKDNIAILKESARLEERKIEEENIKQCHKFYCKKCKFFTNNRKDYNRHLNTLKHNEETTNKIKHNCKNCDEIFKSKSTLWRHIKKCNSNRHQKLYADNYVKDCNNKMNRLEERINILESINKSSIEKENNILRELILKIQQK